MAIEVSVVRNLGLSRSLANIAAQSRKASKARFQLKKHYYYNESPITVLGLFLSLIRARSHGRDMKIYA